MLDAVHAPLGRMVAVAGLALVAAVARPAHHGHVHRLVLHVPEAPSNYIFLTAWDEGPVDLELPAGELPSITFSTRALVNDGCEWIGTETLVPTGPARYDYSYFETIVACDPDARPYTKTPRTGYVTVE